MRQLLAALLLAPYAMFAGLVTATVTPAHSQDAASYTVQITAGSRELVWNRRQFQTKAECMAAVGNLQAVLDAPEKGPVPTPNGASDLVRSVATLYVSLYQQNGIEPRMTVACVPTPGTEQPA